MSDELLSQATRALRASTKPHRDGMEEMLVRVSRPRSVAARPKLRAFVYALAATFIGVGAWARVTGRLDAVLGEATPAQPHRVTLPANRAAAPPRTATKAAVPAATETVAAPEPSVPPLAGSAASDARPAAKAARNVALPSARTQPAPLPSVSAPATPSVDQLYREAHRAHFGASEPSEAVAAWDRYLAVAGPEARMLIEARYNRATALARAGRVSQAVIALRPFADGAYGNYRREEARALIESLSRDR